MTSFLGCLGREADLAALMALKVLYKEDEGPRRKKVLVMPTWTDNRGNGAAVNKRMTTRYPASAVLMELASQMKAMAFKVQVEWTPRSGNQEADKLANGNTARISPALRIGIEAGELRW